MVPMQAFAKEIASLTAEMRLLSSNVGTAVQEALQQRTSSAGNVHQHSLPASPNMTDRTSALLVPAVVQALKEETEKILKRIELLDAVDPDGPHPSNSLPTSLQQAVSDCRNSLQRVQKIVTESREESSKIFALHHETEMAKLEELSDSVQRIGVDAPRFHAGMLDSLHRHGAQLKQIERHLAGMAKIPATASQVTASPTQGNSPKNSLLGSFQDLSRAVLARRDTEFRTFVEALITREPERQDRDSSLEQVRKVHLSLQ